MDYKWEAGQKVIRHTNEGFASVTIIDTIQRVTPKGTAVIGNTQFSTSGREKTSDVWHKDYIEPSTKASLFQIGQETLRRAMYRKAQRAVEGGTLSKLTRNQLERILEIMEEGKP